MQEGIYLVWLCWKLCSVVITLLFSSMMPTPALRCPWWWMGEAAPPSRMLQPPHYPQSSATSCGDDRGGYDHHLSVSVCLRLMIFISRPVKPIKLVKSIWIIEGCFSVSKESNSEFWCLLCLVFPKDSIVNFGVCYI